jgi:chemotaxis protein histidine kinase CheA
MSGGGGSQSSTSYQTNLPEYAQPFYEEMMARAQAESITPYTPYGGDRTADPSQMQQNVRAEVAGMGPSQGMASAEQNIANLAGAAPGTYSPTSFDPGYTAGTFDAATAQAGMDPYMQAVVAEQKKQIQQDYEGAKAGRAAQAVQAGAFGGGRAGAQEAVAESEMLDRMAMAQAQGLQQAYGTSREQFEAEEARKQQAATMGMSAQQAEEASKQFGATFGQQAQEFQLQAAQAQQAAATASQALEESRLKLQNAVGAEEKAEAQKELDLKYEEFINARDHERQNLAFYNALLRGIPVPTQSSVVQYDPTNTMGQLTGLGIAGLGAYNAFGG